MHQIINIARREYLETIKTKTFILGVLMAPIIISCILFFTNRTMHGSNPARPPLHLDVADFTGALADTLTQTLADYNQHHPQRQIRGTCLPANQTVDTVIENGKERLQQGTIQVLAVIQPTVIEGTGKISLYTYDAKAADLDRLGAVESLLRQAVINQRCEVRHISRDVLDSIRQVPMETIEVGQKDQQQHVQNNSDKVFGMMVPFFFMYLMFMGMVGTGQHMVSSVIEEKNSRVIEVLLAAVSPFELMTGKILGLAGMGLTVVAIWGGAAYGAARYKGLALVLPPDMLVYFVVYFLLGFVLFSSILAGVGSICNTLKETQGLMMPLMMMFIIPLLAWMQLVHDSNGLLARALSFFPPVTPMVMILRLAANPNISKLEIGATLLVLSAGTLGMMWLGAKVFRTGILMVGKRPGLREVCRWIREK